MRLYHSTTEENAAQILRGGFKDGAGLVGAPCLERAVWFCPEPTSYGDTVLYIDLPDDVAANYEIVNLTTPDVPDIEREFLLPAKLANSYPLTLLPE
jgi:hypothetical protein